MDLLRKYPREAIFTLSLSVFFFATRLFSLTKMPIFTDEAIYIRWAQYLQGDFKFWDYSITDGKQPLFIWLMTVLMSFTSDPLMGGRLASVLAGLATAIGLFFLARELFRNRWMGFISAALYAIYPFALVYDRMALYDSLVGTFAVWGLYCVVLLIKYVKVQNAIVLGVVAGFATINKSNGFFTIYLLPAALILFQWSNKKRAKMLFKLLILSGIATFITYALYSSLRLSPYFHIIDQKNATFVYPLVEWIKHPFEYFWGNLYIGQRDWFFKYFGYTFSILVIFSFFIKQQFWREKILLVVWFVAPFLALALFGNTLYPRYIFFMTLSLLPLVSYSLYHLYFVSNNILLYVSIVILALFYPLMTSYVILTDFAKARIPKSDVNQYNNDWPSGTGVRESIAYLRQQKGDVVLYTQGTFGLMPYAYEIYLHKDPRFTIKGLWPIDTNMPQELAESAKKKPTYVVFYQPCPACGGKGIAPSQWSLEPVLTVQKAAYDAVLTLYKVKVTE